MNSSRLPKITVVTPSFNQGPFLEACIRSVLDQKYPKLEFFVFDGGSTDQSTDILKKYSSRLAFWTSAKDKGQSDAINKGFQKATGDIVAWLNSDDFYLPGSLTAVAEAWQARPGAPFYYGDGLRVDEEGHEKSRFFPAGVVPFERRSMAYGLNYILQPSTFMDARCVRDVGFLDESLAYAMDTDLWLKLSGLGQPEPIQGVLAASREYGQTKTSTGAMKRVEEIRALAERHTGCPFTPGAMLYLLDTLTSRVDDRTREDLLGLWAHFSRYMQGELNVTPSGFPAPRAPSLPPETKASAAADPLVAPSPEDDSSDLDELRARIAFLKQHAHRRLLAYSEAERQYRSDVRTFAKGSQDIAHTTRLLAEQLQSVEQRLSAWVTLTGDMAHSLRVLRDTRKSPPTYALDDLLRRFRELG